MIVESMERSRPRHRPALPALARTPVGLVACGLAALLLATSNGYGYHRDELYFRVLGQHPAWGYVDQPPLTPLLGRLATAVFGDHLWALRLPATACTVATAALLALIARELGGGRVAQTLAALGGGSAELIFGHLLLTNPVDDLVWSAVLLCAIRALTREQPRWWLAAGVATGLGMYNKYLVVLLLLSLAAGLALAGPRRVFASRWVWSGVGVAFVLGAPNLVYQATHDWPQLAMSAAMAKNEGAGFRMAFVPAQLLLLGPLLLPFEIAGLVLIWRDRLVRAVAVAYPVMCVIVLATAGQPYYTYGLLLTLYAAGCVAAGRWLAPAPARRAGLRRALVAATLAVHSTAAAIIALPLVPQRSLATAPSINPLVPYQIGWPTYVRQVADVYQALPPDDRARAVVITDNYGQAGAIARYGDRYGLPAVYSGHNELWHLARPPESATVVIMVGCFARPGVFDPCPAHLGDHWWHELNVFDRFAGCEIATTLDNGTGVGNEEGTPVRVCRNPRAPWSQLWPDFRHID
jgi:4-amino-4-deoxy-L-arabinose transferase-like glycosyltransferase